MNFNISILQIRKVKILTFLTGLLLLPSIVFGAGAGGFYVDTRDGLNLSIPQVDQFGGGAKYEYPLTTPPGRNGLDLKLSIRYSSQDADQASIFGYGWSIDIPYIERYNKSGIEKLYTDNYFFSSLSGELSLISGSSYAPKVENGEFLSYSFNGTSWIVKDKKGTVYKFGENVSTRQNNSGDTKTYKWMLEEIRDTNNNYIKYEYYKDAGQIYIDKIKYTGNASTDGIYEVVFTRQNRNDTITQNKGGFPVTTNYRISLIEVKANANWVRKYVLNYTNGNNSQRSLLSSITESGQDELSNIISLPPTTFTYQTPGGGPDFVTDDNWNTPVSQTIHTATRFGAIVADVNGDALPDIMESMHNGSYWYKGTYLNQGDGTWIEDTNLTPPIEFSCPCAPGGYHMEEGIRAVDVNGDSFTDLVQSVNLGGGYVGRTYINNNGNSWVLDTTWEPKGQFFNSRDGDTAFRLVDVNGDALPDFIYARGDNDGNSPINSYVHINTGSSWGEQDTEWSIPVDVRFGAIFIDYNGDGLVDILKGHKNSAGVETKQAYKNNGDKTWSLDSNYTPSIVFSVSENGGLPKSTGTNFVDINGDSLIDILSGSNSEYGVYLNKGTGWYFSTSWDFELAGIPLSDDPVRRINDFDGDGMPDIYDSFPTRATLSKNQRVKADLLKTISNSFGSTSTITYKTSPKYKSGNSLLNPKLPVVVDTLYQMTTTSGFGAPDIVKTYSYEGGEYYFNNHLDRKFSGFGKIIESNTNTKTTRYLHQGNTTNSSQGEYDDHPSKIGKIYRTELADISGNIYEKTINKWDRYNQGVGRDFVKLVRTTNMTYDGDADHKDKAEEYTYDNTYGNVTQKVSWGEVTASNDGSFTDTGADKYTESISYTANTADYIVGLPYQSTVLDQSANKVRESRVYYDGQASGFVTDGNATKEEKWKSGTTYVNTQKAYNTTYGTVTSSTDERGKVTNYAYDSYNLYPATVTNPLSQITSYLYDYSAGKPKQVTDANNFVYQTIFDGLDRVKEEKVPDLASPYSPVTKTSYTYTDTSGAVRVQKTDYLDNTNSVDTHQYFDGLNRLIQERTEAETTGEFNVRDVAYNNLDQVLKDSLKYTSTGSAKTSATSTSSLYNNYTYDPMGRVLTVSNSVGITTNLYDDWKTSVTDTNGDTKHYYNDAYGNLAKVEEINSGATYTTNYEWNGNKLLTKITDALGNIRNFTYDGLGRRLTAEDLHAPADGTFGTWSYTYDDAGNLTQTVDPKNQTVNYTYNDINQNLTEDYTGASGTEVTNTYGGCMNGVGKLCAVNMTSGANTSYTYDSNGNIASETKNISSTDYTTTYIYDRLGNKINIVNPDNSEFKYIYNSAGLLNKIERKESGGSFTDVVTNFDYNPMGQVALQEDANGFSTTNTYDATKLYRLTRKLTAQGTGGEEMPLIENQENIPVEADAPIAEEVPRGQAKKLTDTFITNVHDVKAWRKYHSERVEYMRENNVPEGILQKAEYAQNEYENFLIDKKYISEPHGEIRPVKKLWDALKNIISFFAPEKVYAYVFGVEDFEACSVLPCSFSSSDPWGGVTSSLDNTSKVAGEDSLKNVVTGEGGSGLVKSGLSTQELWFKIKVYIPSPMNFGPSGYASIAVLEDSSTNKLVWLNIEDWGTTRVTVDGDTLAYTNTGIDLVQGAVNTIQVRVKMGATNGDVDIWLNNDTEGSPNYNGSGTMNVGTNNIDRFQAGLVYTPENGVSTTYHDDIIIDSAFIGGAGGPAITIVQDLNYTYDANGNILTIVDNSETNTAKTTTYTYDDLNRLLTSTITNSASGGNGTQTFTYNAIGNITSGPEGAYIYNATGYANPHAVTTIDTDSYTYDNNGNTIAKGTGLPWYSTGGTWTNRKQLTIDHTKVSGGADLTSFPVLVNITDATLKTVANGGAVGKSDGTDILFTASDGVTKLSHEIEKYNATTGNLIAWVKVPTLAYATDTSLVIYYGNASASDQQDKVNVWDSNTKGVWHFNNSINDSTTNANNGTNYSSTNTTSGKVGDARNLTASGSRVTVPSNTSLKPTQQLTMSFWAKRNGVQATYAKPVWFGQVNGTPWGPYGIELNGTSDTNTVFKVSSDTTDHYTVASTNMANTTWYHIAGTYDGTNIKYYINGNLEDTETVALTIGNYDTTYGLGIGAAFQGVDKWNGYIDELKISSTARTQGWLTTEYNNQNSPGTFLTLGEVSGSGTSYAYNYKNQLVSTSINTSYLYDHTGSRVKNVTPTLTTIIPSPYYSKEGSTDVKYVLDNKGTLIATIRGTTPYYIHTDHLGSSEKTTDTTATLVETSDYYSYGSPRISESTINDRKGYIGKDYDDTTALSYLNARYYEGSRGQFISQDPVFIALGDNGQVASLAKRSLESLLMDPQMLNSYSYARNNPIRYTDPDGKIAVVDDLAGFAIGGIIGFTIQVGTSLIVDGQLPTGGEMAGAFVTGGVAGWAAVNAPTTGGASVAVGYAVLSGGVAGFTGNSVKQGVDIASGAQDSFSGRELLTNTAISAGTAGLTQGLPQARIPGLSAGRGNMDAVGKGLQTKMATGVISNMSMNTALKSAIGNQSSGAYRTGTEGILNGIWQGVNNISNYSLGSQKK